MNIKNKGAFILPFLIMVTTAAIAVGVAIYTYATSKKPKATPKPKEIAKKDDNKYHYDYPIKGYVFEIDGQKKKGKGPAKEVENIIPDSVYIKDIVLRKGEPLTMQNIINHIENLPKDVFFEDVEDNILNFYSSEAMTKELRLRIKSKQGGSRIVTFKVEVKDIRDILVKYQFEGNTVLEEKMELELGQLLNLKKDFELGDKKYIVKKYDEREKVEDHKDTYEVPVIERIKGFGFMRIPKAPKVTGRVEIKIGQELKFEDVISKIKQENTDLRFADHMQSIENFDSTEEGERNVFVKVTFKNGSSRILEVPVFVSSTVNVEVKYMVLNELVKVEKKVMTIGNQLEIDKTFRPESANENILRYEVKNFENREVVTNEEGKTYVVPTWEISKPLMNMNIIPKKETFVVNGENGIFKFKRGIPYDVYRMFKGLEYGEGGYILRDITTHSINLNSLEVQYVNVQAEKNGASRIVTVPIQAEDGVEITINYVDVNDGDRVIKKIKRYANIGDEILDVERNIVIEENGKRKYYKEFMLYEGISADIFVPKEENPVLSLFMELEREEDIVATEPETETPGNTGAEETTPAQPESPTTPNEGQPAEEQPADPSTGETTPEEEQPVDEGNEEEPPAKLGFFPDGTPVPGFWGDLEPPVQTPVLPEEPIDGEVNPEEAASPETPEAPAEGGAEETTKPVEGEPTPEENTQN